MANDNKKNEENAQPAGPAIMFNSQYIKDFSLEIPFAPQIFTELRTQPDVSINVDVNGSHLGENMFNVELNFSLNGDINGKKLFVLELTYGGLVQLNVPQEHVEPVLLIEVPRMLFPFARSIISNSMMEAGLPPFMINPIDFVAMYQNRKQPE